MPTDDLTAHWLNAHSNRTDRKGGAQSDLKRQVGDRNECTKWCYHDANSTTSRKGKAGRERICLNFKSNSAEQPPMRPERFEWGFLAASPNRSVPDAP